MKLSPKAQNLVNQYDVGQLAERVVELEVCIKLLENKLTAVKCAEDERIGDRGWRIWGGDLPQDVVPLGDAEGVVAALEARVQRLTEYAAHKEDCQLVFLGNVGTSWISVCTCGLQEALDA